MAKPIKVEMLQTWMGTTYRVYVHGGVLGRGVELAGTRWSTGRGRAKSCGIYSVPMQFPEGNRFAILLSNSNGSVNSSAALLITRTNKT